MKPQKEARKFNDHWEYSLNELSVKDKLMERDSVKGSQFQEPLMEFSGACSGYGETPYVKLLTQLFGERMVIANSSGCSSVWGGSYGLSPFRKNKDGQGPAWARSLFEDTAEYGLGMALASQQRRDELQAEVTSFLQNLEKGSESQPVSVELKAALTKWTQIFSNAEQCNKLLPTLKDLLAREVDPLAETGEGGQNHLKRISDAQDLLVAPSHWIIGGDGWAYDIGFGGLDHVLASGQNINILVLDTEGYSNTGAQVSKATPTGAVMKMASGGNKAKKKDLGAIAMMHESAYVASVSLAADVNQTVRAFREAEAYTGPSIVIAYATCVDWGHRAGDKAMVRQQVDVVESGYWPLYRFQPGGAFELDNKRISASAMEQFLKSENRFTTLVRSAPEHASQLQTEMMTDATTRHERRKRLSMDDEDLLEHLVKQLGVEGGLGSQGDRVTVLYGSDTGTSELVAQDFQFEMKRRGMKAKCLALNDMEVADLADETKILAIVATAGQGEMPKTAKTFWDQMETFLESAPTNHMANVQYAVFGMGDSSYVFFNEAAKKVDEAFVKLGAQRLQPMGNGDAQDPERYDSALEDWSPNFYDMIA